MAKACSVPFYKTADFKALDYEWKKKLAESGFRDIEQVDPRTGEPGELLLGMSVGDLRRGLYSHATERYHDLARIHTRRIVNRLRLAKQQPSATPTKLSRLAFLRDAWSFHAEGFSYKAIAFHLGCSEKRAQRYIERERRHMLALDEREDNEGLDVE